MEERGFHGFLGNTISERKLPIFISLSAFSGTKIVESPFLLKRNTLSHPISGTTGGSPRPAGRAIQGLNYLPLQLSQCSTLVTPAARTATSPGRWPGRRHRSSLRCIPKTTCDHTTHRLSILGMVRQGRIFHTLLDLKSLRILARFVRNRLVEIGGHTVDGSR